MGHLPSRSVEAQREMALGQRKGRSKPSNLREQIDPEQVAVYQEAKNWPTPTESDMKDTWNGGRGETLVSKMKEKRSGKLNPDWCEQLMGLPVGWTKINDADDRISRLMAIGNGVVPQTAALAWVTLSEKIKQ